MGVVENKRLVEERYLPSTRRGDVEGMLECLNDDATVTIIGSTPWSGVYSKQGQREYLNRLLATVEGGTPRLTVSMLIGENDHVVDVVRSEFTVVDGESIGTWACHVYRFASNGKIQEIIEFVDTDVFGRVLASVFGDFRPVDFRPHVAAN